MKMKKPLSKGPKAPYYIAPPIKKMLDKAKHQVLNQDWDRLYLIDGSEGAGKSLLGLQLGKYLDPTLNINSITFSGGTFSKAIDKATKGQCIIFDEAFNGLASSAAMSKMNRFIVRKLMECRQKNLFIIIILPTFFLLQKYVAIFRSKVLFHVYVPKSGARGYYRAYNSNNKKLLFLTGQKFYSYSQPYIRNSFRYYEKYPIDEAEYRKKKAESLKDEDKKTPDSKYMVKWYKTIALLRKSLSLSEKKTSELLKLHGVQIEPTRIGEISREFLGKTHKTPVPDTPYIYNI